MNHKGTCYAVRMTETPRFHLKSVHGPEEKTVNLVGNTITIGRSNDCDVPLVKGATVSRTHATLTKFDNQDDGQWRLIDNGSKHGTFLNGVKLREAQYVGIRGGDIITIEPFSFQVIDRKGDHQFTQTFDDEQSIGGTSIQRIERTMGGAGLAQERLAALLACSSKIHEAENERVLAQSLADAAQAGTAFSNVAVIKPHGGDAQVEILAASGRIAIEGSPNLSRSLLHAALDGEAVRYQKADVVEEDAQSIMQYSIQEAFCIPIQLGAVVVGCIYVDNRDGQVRGQTIDDDIEFCTGLSKFASLAMANLMRAEIERRHAEERQGLLLGTVAALVSAIDAKDTYTRGHSERVAWLSKALANAIELDEETVGNVHICGLVHDIGKIGIPEAILRKPSRLTDEEFDQIKLHPVIGENILRDVPQLHNVLPGVRSHHERWDGRGYPDGTKGDKTSLYGRILGVADAFDAMCSSRAYRNALNREDVLDEITACAGSQFDPELAKAFLTIDFAPYDEMIQRHISQDSIE